MVKLNSCAPIPEISVTLLLLSVEFRLVALNVKLVGILSMPDKTQDRLRDPAPFSVAISSVGAEGGPTHIYIYIGTKNG